MSLTDLLVDLFILAVVLFTAYFFIALAVLAGGGIYVAVKEFRHVDPRRLREGLLAYVIVVVGGAFVFSPLLIPAFLGWIWLLVAGPLVVLFVWLAEPFIEGLDL